MSPLEEARAAFLSTKVPPKPITFWRAFCARNEHEILRREDRAPTVDEVQAVEECYECLRAGYEEDVSERVVSPPKTWQLPTPTMVDAVHLGAALAEVDRLEAAQADSSDPTATPEWAEVETAAAKAREIHALATLANESSNAETRADAQRQLDRAQVSALLDTAGVPAHADLAERVTMLIEHDREMAADGLRLAEVIEDRNNCRQRLARVREEIGEHAEDCEQQRAHLANPGRVGACSWCRPLSALTQDAIAEDPS